MPTYLIEREIPGASKLTDDELRGITQTSNDAVDGLDRPYTWRHSYVAGDKIYCVHEAESAEDVLEHARARRASRRTSSPRSRPCSTAPARASCPSDRSTRPRGGSSCGRPSARRRPAIRRIRS